MTDMNEVILKADRRGRLRYTPEQKQALIEAYQTSGLSCPRFAAMHGVNYQTLVSWLKKHRQADSDHPALRSLVPAELDSISPSSATARPMEILLPCGVKLAVHTLSQMDMAASLIRKLSRPC
jgi:transposase-like protein